MVSSCISCVCVVCLFVCVCVFFSAFKALGHTSTVGSVVCPPPIIFYVPWCQVCFFAWHTHFWVCGPRSISSKIDGKGLRGIATEHGRPGRWGLGWFVYLRDINWSSIILCVWLVWCCSTLKRLVWGWLLAENEGRITLIL